MPCRSTLKVRNVWETSCTVLCGQSSPVWRTTCLRWKVSGCESNGSWSNSSCAACFYSVCNRSHDHSKEWTLILRSFRTFDQTKQSKILARWRRGGDILGFFYSFSPSTYMWFVKSWTHLEKDSCNKLLQKHSLAAKKMQLTICEVSQSCGSREQDWEIRSGKKKKNKAEKK